MSRAKLMAALAAVTTTVAVAAPAGSASAQPLPIVYAPPPYLCAALVSQIQWALATGNPVLANLIAQTFINIGCGGAAT